MHSPLGGDHAAEPIVQGAIPFRPRATPTTVDASSTLVTTRLDAEARARRYRGTATADTGIASALTGVLGGMDLGGWLRSARSGSPSADRYGSRLPRDSAGLLAWDACLPLPRLRVRLSHEFVSCSVSLGGLQADRGVWNRPSSVHTPRNAVSAPLRLFPLNPYKLSRSCGSSV